MSGHMSLLPRPLSPGEDIAARFLDIDARLRDLEINRPALSTGQGDPSGVATQGTFYIDELNGRSWVYDGSQWLVTSGQRAYSEDLGTWNNTAVGTTNVLPNAEFTIYIPTGQFVGLYVEGEIKAPNASSTGYLTITWPSAPINYFVAGSSSLTYEKVSTIGGSPYVTGFETNSWGAGAGVGGMWAITVDDSGYVTFTPGIYSATGAGAAVCSFRNIKCYAFVL